MNKYERSNAVAFTNYIFINFEYISVCLFSTWSPTSLVIQFIFQLFTEV